MANESFKVFSDAKIPVSKHLGTHWKSRRDVSLRIREKRVSPAWREAIRYYNHDQTHKERAGPDRDSSSNAPLGGRYLDYTENVIFGIVNSMIPHVYMKNPVVEVTAIDVDNEEMARFATVSERLLNALAAKKDAPGFNYKGKAKRAVVVSLLTNRAWVEVGYTKRQDSTDQALEDLRKLSVKYQQAKSPQELERIEGQLIAIERKISFLRPPGPWAKFRSPNDVLVDTASENDDASDANWIMVREFIRTSELQAQFMRKQPGRETHVSIFNPTHIIRTDTSDDTKEQIDNFTLFGGGEDFQKHGFSNQESFRAAQMTMVWWVWDKSTRRLMLFHNDDWSWPIWVWDDPYLLDKFFPLEPLTLFTHPLPGDTKGEASYYLDQQDEINVINSEKRKARAWVRRKVLYNTNLIDHETADRFIKTPDEGAYGVDLPPEADLTAAISALAPPSMNFPQLFDKTDEYNQINRLSAGNEILQGAQFKTNTTNRAIDTYSSIQSTRLDEYTDAVEDHTGQVFWMILQMCIQNMTPEEVGQILGEEDQRAWRNMSPQEIRGAVQLRIIGGSAIKPTAQTKKNQALEIGQVLGQFVQISPVAFLVALKVLERAFDEITVTEEEWQAIRQSVEQQLNSSADGEAGGEAGGSGIGNEQEIIEQASAIIDQLPPEAKRALGDALARGVPIVEAVQEIVTNLQGEQQAA